MSEDGSSWTAYAGYQYRTGVYCGAEDGIAAKNIREKKGWRCRIVSYENVWFALRPLVFYILRCGAGGLLTYNCQYSSDTSIIKSKAGGLTDGADK